MVAPQIVIVIELLAVLILVSFFSDGIFEQELGQLYLELLFFFLRIY